MCPAAREEDICLSMINLKYFVIHKLVSWWCTMEQRLKDLHSAVTQCCSKQNYQKIWIQREDLNKTRSRVETGLFKSARCNAGGRAWAAWPPTRPTTTTMTWSFFRVCGQRGPITRPPPQKTCSPCIGADEKRRSVISEHSAGKINDLRSGRVALTDKLRGTHASLLLGCRFACMASVIIFREVCSGWNRELPILPICNLI